MKQSLILAALLGNLSVKEVKAMSLQAQNAAKRNNDYDWGPTSEEGDDQGFEFDFGGEDSATEGDQFDDEDDFLGESEGSDEGNIRGS